MDARIRQAHADIDIALTRATMEPYVISSFGKDSLVLLDMLSQHGVTNVLHLEDVDEVVDWPFIERTCERYRLQMTRLGRGRVLFGVINDTPVFTAMTFLSDRWLAVFPTQMKPYEGQGSFVCVDQELSAMRTTALDVQFDCLFSGAKRADLTSKNCLSFMNLLPEPLVEKRAREEFATYVHRERQPNLWSCDPLLHWTDTDVWDYIVKYDVPWSRLVYNEDHTKRPTNAHWCYRCHDPRENSIVVCPRLGKSILNFSGMAHDSDLHLERLYRLGLLNAEEKEAIRAQQ
jgi:3'-phosphoadenosine 5'-phosphosulfate sulfotransferase (PAPS reductase)/FAD synthetase